MPLPLGRKPGAEDEEEKGVPDGQDAWITIDKTVRKVDEDKVKDCTDDIDTLLVFAGLFSAALTALLIESYKNLQVDHKEELLMQIAGQGANYRFTGGFLNSTFDPSQIPPFQVALSDLQVNVCWFASLILSLAAASYGILVKQWLREYLAIDRTAPHERMRIRHFRARGIEEWKLFEIAAFLPVLLQISLTLFFVGLCFFTASVHPFIGRTSICLVGGWAFFFVCSVLAPLFSARCPYRTTFLKAILRNMRPHVLHTVQRTHRNVRSILSRVQLPLLSYFLPRIQTSLASTTLSLYRRLIAGCHLLLRPTVVSTEPQIPMSNLFYTQYDLPDEMNLAILARFCQYEVSEDTITDEEFESSSNESSDLAIFRVVDSTFLDDRLLEMIREALRRRPQPGGETLKFVIHVFQSRSSATMRPSTARSVPWPWTLSHIAREALVSILTDALLSHLSKTSVKDWFLSMQSSQHPWTQDALELIFALLTPQLPVPKATTTLFARLLQAEHGSGLAIIKTLIREGKEDLEDDCRSRWSAHILACMATTLKMFPGEVAADSLVIILGLSFLSPEHTILDPLADIYGTLLLRINDQSDKAKIPVTYRTILVLVDLAGIILHTLIGMTTRPIGKELGRQYTQLLSFIFRTIPLTKDLKTDINRPRVLGGLALDKVFIDLYTTPHLVHSMLDFSLKHAILWTGDCHEYLLQFVGHINLTSEPGLNFLSACEEYFRNRSRFGAFTDLLTLVRLCHLIYEMSIPVGPLPWRAMLDQINVCVGIALSTHRISYSLENSNLCEAACGILNILDEETRGRSRALIGDALCDEDTSYSQWKLWFDEGTSDFPDGLVKTLHHIICDRHRQTVKDKVWRVRRLEETERVSGPPFYEADTHSRDLLIAQHSFTGNIPPSQNDTPSNHAAFIPSSGTYSRLSSGLVCLPKDSQIPQQVHSVLAEFEPMDIALDLSPTVLPYPSSNSADPLRAESRQDSETAVTPAAIPSSNDIPAGSDLYSASRGTTNIN